VTEIDPSYRSLTCYNHGESSHFVRICGKPKVRFICVVPGYYMTECPKWKKTQPIGSYMGSAGSGLGFYHIDLLQIETTRWVSISNCGLVIIKKGNISLSEIRVV
jgi:hypothetical protein